MQELELGAVNGAEHQAGDVHTQPTAAAAPTLPPGQVTETDTEAKNAGEEQTCQKCEGAFPKDGYNDCKSCRSKRVLLTRMFGNWPIAQFNSLDKELQTQFWQTNPETSARKDLFITLTKTVTTAKIQYLDKGEKGKYLPLSAYAAKGFNTEDIQEKCTDFEDHPILGMTYKVDIKCESKGEIEETVRKELLDLNPNLGSGRQLPKKRARTSSSSSNSSKSSGSSSPSPKARAAAKRAAAKAEALEKKKVAHVLTPPCMADLRAVATALNPYMQQ